MGLARRVISSHSRMVGRSAVRSNSFLMKSERLMPCRAARAFSVACNWSGTSLTWIIFDMFPAYKHVLHMSITLGRLRLRSRYNWNLENREIARILWETADLMEIAGDDS